MKEKRLFLALPIPEDLKKEIAQERSRIPLPLKWIPDQNLHVTVLFLGSVTEQKIPALIQTTDSVVQKFSSFFLHAYSLKIQKSRFQYMIWTDFHRSVEFENLSKQLADSLGYATKRKATPHINLVRSKNKIDLDIFPIKLEREIFIPVSSIELWESHLSPKGATYSCLNSFYLKSG